MKGIWITVAVVFGSLLAGCADPEATATSTTGTGGQTIPDAPSNEPQSISGTVIDTEFRPIPDATVTLTPGEQVASTDTSGAFAFYELEPGTYTLMAEKDGYINGSLKVDLVGEPVSKVVLSLEALPSDDAIHETRIFNGYLLCFIAIMPPTSGSMPCSPGAAAVLGSQNLGDEKVRFAFEISKSGFRHLIFEAKWTKPTFDNDIQYFIESPTPGVGQKAAKSYMSDSGGTPVWDEVKAGTKHGSTDAVFYPTPDAKENYEFYFFGFYGNATPIGLQIEWRPEFHLTFFYNGLAPSGFSAIPKD